MILDLSFLRSNVAPTNFRVKTSLISLIRFILLKKGEIFFLSNLKWILGGLNMSLRYVENSFRRIDENTLEFKLVNNIESGSGYVSVKILLDSKDVTDKSTMKIRTQESRKVSPYMFVTSNYGDDVIVQIKLDEPIEKGVHNVKVICNVEMLGTYTVEFKGSV